MGGDDRGATRELAPAEAHGLWRTEIALRVRELRNRLDAARASGAGGGGAQSACHVVAVEQALSDATEAIATDRWTPRALLNWWTGATITAAWESVHRAEAQLVEIGSDGDALAALPQLRTWMDTVMTDTHQLAAYEQAFDAAVKAGHAPDRTTLRQAYQDTIAANVDWHSGLRAFRNILFSVAAAIGLVLLGLSIWHAIHPGVISLCRTASGATTCFGDGARPAGRALLEVTLVGAVGGLLSSAFLLGKMEHAPSRYNLLAPQVVLKASAGAATALIGVLLVVSHVIVAPVGGDSTAVLLAYAAVFGFSQQLLTQFVDKRGADLINPQQKKAAKR